MEAQKTLSIAVVQLFLFCSIIFVNDLRPTNGTQAARH